MDDKEKKARQDFFAQTGKTPEQEGQDSARALGLILIASVLITAAAAYGIYERFFAFN